MLTTPLQLATATSALAMKGEGVQPRFLRAIRSQEGLEELAHGIAMQTIEVSNQYYWDQIISCR